MKIYFAGSIRGGRDDAALYSRLVAHMKTYGKVLTEHVGDEDLLEDCEKDLSDKDIHDRDEKWLAESDVIIAEATTLSLGVGYEIALARHYGKNVLCLFRPSGTMSDLSAMIAGAPHVTVVKYSNLIECKTAIDEWMRTRV